MTTDGESVRHETAVKYQRAWGEHRPECLTCGWVGSYLRTVALAEAEAHAHRAEHGEAGQ